MVIKKTTMRIANLLEKHSQLVLRIAIILVLILGAIYAFILGDSLRFLPDEQDYLALADHLVTQGRYTLDGALPTAYRPPGYPSFLSLLRLFTANIFWLRLLNFAAISTTLFFCYKILAGNGSHLAGALGTLLVAAYPVLIYTAGTFYPQVLAGALLVTSTWLLVRPQSGSLASGTAGILFGWLILCVPIFILTSGVYFIWLVVFQGSKRGLIFLLTMLLVVGAWTARNWVVMDSFIFVSTNSGENLLLGNSEKTTPNGGRTIDIGLYESAVSGLDEVARDRYYRDQALRYIREHPLESARMYVLKVLNYFNYRNDLVTSDQSSVAKDLVLLAVYGPLLGLFLVRLFLIKRFRLTPVEILLVSVYLSSALFNAIFFTRIRFRLPFDILLILCVASFLSLLVQRWAGKADTKNLRLKAQ